MRYLSKRNIIFINRMTVEKHGGNFIPPSNILHEDSIDYLIEAVSSEMFGQPLYPTLGSKAGLYMYNISGVRLIFKTDEIRVLSPHV